MTEIVLRRGLDLDYDIVLHTIPIQILSRNFRQNPFIAFNEVFSWKKYFLVFFFSQKYSEFEIVIHFKGI